MAYSFRSTTYNTNYNSKDDSLDDYTCSNMSMQPQDTVSDISFLPDSNFGIFCCSSWDGLLKIYDSKKINYNSGELTQSACFQHPEPILCCDWKKDKSIIFAGTGDN